MIDYQKKLVRQRGLWQPKWRQILIPSSFFFFSDRQQRKFLLLFLKRESDRLTKRRCVWIIRPCGRVLGSLCLECVVVGQIENRVIALSLSLLQRWSTSNSSVARLLAILKCSSTTFRLQHVSRFLYLHKQQITHRLYLITIDINEEEEKE